MTRLQIVNQALRELGEGTSVSHWGGTTPVLDWLHDAKVEFETETRVNFGTAAAVTATSGDRIITLATAMFHPVYVRYKGKYLTKTDRTTLIDDESSNSYLVSTGLPSQWYVAEGFNKIGLYPIVGVGDGGSVVAEGYRTTTRLTADTSVPSFNPQFHRALVAGLKIHLCDEDSDASRSERSRGKAEIEYRKYVAMAARETERGRFVIHASWNDRY